MTVTDLAEAIRRLRTAGCVFAEDEAAVLGEAATDARHLAELVGRRARGEPLEQVVGYADFCGVRVRLRRGVFVPRVRSELLVHTAAAEQDDNHTTAAEQDDNHTTAAEQDDNRTTAAKQGVVVVDLCCGSGALGLALRRLRPDITLYAADHDPAAVACALDNLGGDVFQGDLFDALPAGLRGRIDILLANVPYVATRHIPLLPAEAREHEPHRALDGGGDGLDVFRAVVAGAARWLSPGGLMLSEISEAQTAAAVAAVRAAGLLPDLAEDDELDARVVTARRAGQGVSGGP
ncbi:methyltransferase [Actinoplanes sp. NPDC026623]|uniref:methyltransferase n=1 Tax=Actinoplanes sp. NPDC026623 TaxID=3155610 RepID=UPI003408553F